MTRATVQADRALGLLRSPVLSVYALTFLNAVFLTAFVPVAPTFEDDLDLSTVEVGALFAANGGVFVLVAVPLGVLADRVGARAVTIVAPIALAAGAVGHAVAVDFPTLMAARVVFGLGSAAVLIAGFAWLTDSAPPARRASALAVAMPVAGIGALVGPTFAGQLADRAGTAAPFLAIAGLSVLVGAMLARSDRGVRARHGYHSIVELFAAARAERLVLVAVVLFLLGGLAEAIVNVLAPIQLDENGVSAGSIGVILSAGAGVFVAVSVLVARRARRATTLPVAAGCLLALAASLLPLVVSTSTLAVAAGVIARVGVLGVLYTIAFPLGAFGAARAALGLAAVNGLLIFSSGIANSVGPLGGAGLAAAVGDRWVYIALTGACVAAAAWVLAGSRREAVPSGGRPELVFRHTSE